jgi:spermidine synthase
MSPRRGKGDMVVELMQDLDRPGGYWLVVDASEQSFVDLDDPAHLEFEYVQMMAYVIEAAFPDDTPLAALHLGGGLCTVPRWVAELHPGSRQRIAENSPEIAAMARSLGDLSPVGDLVVTDGLAMLAETARGSLDLLVVDVYEGPETVLSVFTHDAVKTAHEALRPGGWYVCNLSDAVPFALTKTVVATIRELFRNVVMLAEPATLRGRRSGNVVLGVSDSDVPLDAIVRRATSGPLRARVVAGEDLAAFVGGATPAYDVESLPPSGDSPGRLFR